MDVPKGYPFMCLLLLYVHYDNVCVIMYSPFESFCILAPFRVKRAFWSILTLCVIFDLKLDSCSYYDMWWMFMWYNIALCFETIVYSLVRTVFAKVGFCSVLSILRASFGFWWVRKLIREIQRYNWVIRGRAGLGVRFRGLRFRDLGIHVAWGVCHVSPREACIDF